MNIIYYGLGSRDCVVLLTFLPLNFIFNTRVGKVEFFVFNSEYLWNNVGHDVKAVRGKWSPEVKHFRYQIFLLFVRSFCCLYGQCSCLFLMLPHVCWLRKSFSMTLLLKERTSACSTLFIMSAQGKAVVVTVSR